MCTGHTDPGIADFIEPKDGNLCRHKSGRKVLTMFTHPHRLASIAQVAADLGYSYRTIHRWTRNGKLPATKIGGQVRIHWSDVEALLAKGKIPVDDVTGNGLI